MVRQFKAWQKSMVREKIFEYRRALENYYIRNKKIIRTASGDAFSLLSPPVASMVSRRRLRYIVANLINQNKAAGPAITLASRTPHFVTLAVTYDCQCNCLHCSASAYKDEVRREDSLLSPAEIKKIIRETISLGTTSIVFTGGEPLLRKDIYDLIAGVDKTKAIVTVFTNGEYLGRETAKKLKQSGASGVFVSFDFADSARHDANRGRKGIFLKAKAGIAVAQKEGLLTGISTYVTKDKIASGDLELIMDLGKELGVLEVFIFDVIPVGKLNGACGCALGESEFGLIRDFRKRYNELSDYPRIIHQTMLTSIAYPCAGEGCPAGVAHMHIRANGDVSPCDFTAASYGNIREKSLKRIWQELSGDKAFAEVSSVCRLSRKEGTTGC